MTSGIPDPGAFDPAHSPLERDPALAAEVVSAIEDTLGDEARVAAVLEIGSYAKGEAVPASDTDTRVYVTLPGAYLLNSVGSAGELSERWQEFVRVCGDLPRVEHTWAGFNIPLCEQIADQLGINLEFGLSDRRFAAFELGRLDQAPSKEHAMLFQSNVVFDPEGFVSTWRRALEGRIYTAQAQLYQERFLQGLRRRLWSFLEPHPWDAYKLEKSAQIQWVQQAVRCLRNAVAAHSYLTTGRFAYRKEDVLRFYRRQLPEHTPFVEELYEWKTDSQVRADMIVAFRGDPDPLYALFRERMPRLEAAVAAVHGLLESDLAESSASGPKGHLTQLEDSL